jgi:hypothetical protein
MIKKSLLSVINALKKQAERDELLAILRARIIRALY